MAVHLSKEIVKLKKNILHLSASVEENVRVAVRSVAENNPEEAEKVIQSDLEIDKMEIDIEEECLKILALYQPVAIDLRYVIACLKMNNDLERIGDLAVNIAKRAIATSEFSDEENGYLDFTLMMEKTREMLKKALDSLIDMDEDLAEEVMKEDDVLDEYNKQMHIEVNRLIKQNPAKSEYFIHLLCVSRHLERIGDYCTNIAEDVIYMVNGAIIRHGLNG